MERELEKNVDAEYYWEDEKGDGCAVLPEVDWRGEFG
jgi:hypothetical protein